MIARALVLVVVGAALGVVSNALRPDGIPLGPFAEPTACAVPATTPTVQSLTAEEAVRACGDPGVLLADVRPAARFAEGHVSEAIHLPCAASGSDVSRALTLLEGKHTIIVYGEGTADARPVAEDLQRRANRPGLRVVVLEGGFAAWSAAGLACSSGPCPDCKESRTR